jgi:hypothetical protein
MAQQLIFHGTAQDAERPLRVPLCRSHAPEVSFDTVAKQLGEHMGLPGPVAGSD